MSKYMIGDVFGNMYRGIEDEFYCNIGAIHPNKKSAIERLEYLENQYPRLENKLRIWEIKLVKE